MTCGRLLRVTFVTWVIFAGCNGNGSGNAQPGAVVLAPDDNALLVGIFDPPTANGVVTSASEIVLRGVSSGEVSDLRWRNETGGGGAIAIASP